MTHRGHARGAGGTRLLRFTEMYCTMRKSPISKGENMRLHYSPLARGNNELQDALSSLLHLYTEARRIRDNAWLGSEKGLDYALADAQRTLVDHGLVEVRHGSL